MNAAEFAERSSAIIAEHSAVKMSAAGALAAWEQFVSRCEAGYDEDFSEYLNDLGIRDLLELILTDPRLSESSPDQLEWFRDAVTFIDGRFREIVLEGILTQFSKARWGVGWWPALGQIARASSG